MSNSEVMEKIATKLDNLRTSILEGQIRAEHVIADKLQAIREYAEENNVEFIIDDEDYIDLLKDGDLGEEEEEYSEEYSEEEDSSY